MKSKTLLAVMLLLGLRFEAFAEIVSFQTDTAERLMPLVDRVVLGGIISSIILGLSLIVAAHFSRKK